MMPDRKAASAAVILLVLLIAAEIAFAFRPSSTFWALSNGAGLPLPLRAAWIALLPAALAAALLAARSRGVRRAPSPPTHWAIPLLAAAAAAVLFHLLRSRAHFMGDGYLMITLLERDGDPLSYRAGWGTLAVHRFFFRALRALGATNGEELSFTLLSSAAGGVAVFAAVRYARRIAGALRPDRPGAAAALLLAILFTTGATQLYFGHVETYTTAQLFLLLFAAGGCAALLGAGSRAAAAVALAAAIFFHTGTIFALPALAVLLAEGRERRLSRLFLRGALLSPILLFLLPPTVAQTGLNTTPLSWTAHEGSIFYGILSKDHLLFLLNLFVLLVPLPTVVLIGTTGARSDGEDPRIRRVDRFLRTASLSLLAFAVVIRPGLGPRDWDLFCFFAPALALWAGTRALPRLPSRALPAAAVAAWGAGLFLLLPWAAGNAVPSVSAERALRFSWGDPLHWRGDEPRAVGLAGLLWERGERERGMRLYREVTRRLPDNRRARANVGIDYWKSGEYEKAMAHLQEAVRLNPAVRAPRYYLGSCMLHLRVGDWGERHFRFILAHDPNEPAAALDLGSILYERKEWAEARHWLSTALAFWPEKARIHAMIGQASFHLGDRGAAEEHLRRAYELDPESVGGARHPFR